jgi:uncharacterized protein
MQKRVVRLLVVAVIALILLLYVGGGFVLYEQFGRVLPGCAGSTSPETPAQFTLGEFDTTPYLMPDYENVEFPARDDGVLIRAYYVPPQNGAVIVLAHGINACKETALLPAGMLHRHGYGVLLIDLRNMGASQADNQHMAAGAKEYKDVLGAVDWLISAQDIAPERIGLYGFSLGGATTLIAYGRDTRIRAAWVDSAFADVEYLVDEQLIRSRMTLMKPMARLIGRIVYGDDAFALQPLDVLPELGQRPVYLVHGKADTTVPFEQLDILDAALTKANVPHTIWATDSAHVQTMFDYPDAYEQRMVGFFDEYLSE